MDEFMEGKNIVDEFRQLLGMEALLLHCKTGTKKPVGKWKNLTSDSMADPAYLARLGRGNIGVALGRVSGGLVVVDVDIDTLVLPYLRVNPAWEATLQTHGARGCGFWFRMSGDYPARTVKFKTHSGEDAGEFRSNGSQSIIHGIHPNGNPYQIVSKAKPLVVKFESFMWPSAIANPPSLAESKRSNVTQRTQLHSFKAVELVLPLTGTEPASTEQVQALALPCSCVTLAGLEKVMQVAVPTRPHTNHNLLWMLARVVKGLERKSGCKASLEQLFEIFNFWHSRALAFLRPEQTRDEYLLEFMQAYQNAKLPLGETAITEAWRQAQDKPFPSEAIAAFTDDKFRLIVSFCRELQIIAGDEPFFLSCRDLAKLLDKETAMTCSRYLTALCAMGFIEVVVKGIIGPHGKASSYRYKGSLP